MVGVVSIKAQVTKMSPPGGKIVLFPFYSEENENKGIFYSSPRENPFNKSQISHLSILHINYNNILLP